MSDKPDRLGEASDWFARMRGPDGALSLDAFEAWRTDPLNARAYAEIEALWTVSAGADVEIGTQPAPAGAMHPAVRNMLRTGWSGPAIAAALILVAAAVGIALALHARSNTLRRDVVYESAAGAGRTIVLADGSRVTLDRDSRIDVSFGDADRIVRMTSGRSRFAVAHDPARPFVVLVGDRAVVARGTVFDVDASSGLTVSLIEGAVDLERRSSGTRPKLLARLRPGEQASFSSDDGAPRIVLAPPAPWPPTLLAGDAMPLADLVDAANRSGGPRLVLGDRELGRLRVSGGIKPNKPVEMARALAAALDLRVTARSDGSLLLERTTLTPRAQ